MAKKALQMHEPPHPGVIIRALCLEPLGLTVERAATGLGVTRKTLSQLLNGHAGISSEMALRLSGAFGGSAESWLQQQAQYDLWRVRLSAGDLRVERFHGARQLPDDCPAASARSGT